MEFGNINVAGFQLNINTYEGEENDALSVFSDKFDEGPPSNEPSGFLLTASGLKLINGYVEVIDFNKKV